MARHFRSHRSDTERWGLRTVSAVALSAMLAAPLVGAASGVYAAEKGDSQLGIPGEVYRDQFQSEDLPVGTTFEFNEDAWGFEVNYFDSRFLMNSEMAKDPGNGGDPGDPDPDPCPDPRPQPTVTVGTIREGTSDATPYYTIESPNPGPTVMIVGGVHGNEEAGYVAADQVATMRPGRGTLVVLPRAYVRAIDADSRRVSGEQDFNRRFPQSSSDSPSGSLATEIFDLMREVDPDWVLDLHEGFDFYLNPNTDSVGQSVIYHPNGDGLEMANMMVNELNRDISNPNHRFVVLKWPVSGSIARSAGDVLGSQAAILETAWVQPLDVRVDQHLTMVNVLLRELDMLPSDEPICSHVTTIADDTQYETPLHVIAGENPGPTVMVIAGLRGNQDASIQAANRLAEQTIDAGTLLVLPQAYKPAVEQGVPYLPEDGDLNRQFPAQSTGSPNGVLANAIFDVIGNYGVEWVIDLEQADDYEAAGRGQEGNSIISHPGSEAENMANKLANKLNETVNPSGQKWVTLVNPIWTGLIRAVGEVWNANGFYVSTTRKDTIDKQVTYDLRLVNELLVQLGMR